MIHVVQQIHRLEDHLPLEEVPLEDHLPLEVPLEVPLEDQLQLEDHLLIQICENTSQFDISSDELNISKTEYF